MELPTYLKKQFEELEKITYKSKKKEFKEIKGKMIYYINLLTEQG